MEFDKSRVYTALNADELKIGSKVIVANTIKGLKGKVEENEITEINDIKDDCYGNRFTAWYGEELLGYALAYLVSPPEEKKLHWTDLRIGDIVKCKFKNVRHQINGIDEDDKCVFFGGEWTRDKELADWKKVED